MPEVLGFGFIVVGLGFGFFSLQFPKTFICTWSKTDVRISTDILFAVQGKYLYPRFNKREGGKWTIQSA